MIYGIYSDIHGNLQALEAVINSMKEHDVERQVCLGDLVGYGVSPNECVDRVNENADIVIMGNHDSVAAGLESSKKFNNFAQYAIDWTAEILTEEHKNYLRSLPYFKAENDLYFVHATPKAPAEWVYVNSLDESVDAFDFFKEKMCFIGHTHYPLITKMNRNEDFKVLDEFEYTVADDERVVVNVGSVGQPRDRNSDASWCLVDTETNYIKIVRVPYNIKAAQDEMRKLDFPDFLINRLSEGR